MTSSAPRVDELDFDDYNREELAQHGIDLLQVHAVLGRQPLFVRNKRGRAATYKVIGPDNSGTMLTIPIAPTAVPGQWRPVTGWASTRGEVTLWRKTYA
jgi:uncharacterized DUF497 family protein